MVLASARLSCFPVQAKQDISPSFKQAQSSLINFSPMLNACSCPSDEVISLYKELIKVANTSTYL